MHKSCRKSHIRSDKISQIWGGEPRSANCGQFCRVELESFVENWCLVIHYEIRRVWRAIEKLLCQEWEILGIKSVSVVEAYKEYDAPKVTDKVIGQCIQWHPQRRAERSYVVPVERDGNYCWELVYAIYGDVTARHTKTKTLVSRSTTKKIGED